MIFLLATSNKDKMIEFARILEPLDIEVKIPSELGLSLPDVEETGTTFIENALLKAESGAEFSGYPTLADDSGICVDALDGAPGIYSARYSGDEAGARLDKNKANNLKMLRELDGVPEQQRTAHYTCAVACVMPDGRKFTTEGYCFGKIASSENGSNGFGYDPLFIPDEEPGDLTFGQLSSEIKDRLSHRSRAIHKMCDVLKKEVL